MSWFSAMIVVMDGGLPKGQYSVRTSCMYTWEKYDSRDDDDDDDDDDEDMAWVCEE